MSEEVSMPPTTTTEEDLRTKGQRHINLIWETSQAAIALSVVFACIFCAIYKIESVLLANAFFLVIGFYFGRTNHARPK